MGENKYQIGKIYQIVDVGYTKCYIGSTTETLSQRMARHRVCFKDYLKRGGKFTRSFSMFEEFGVENCKIELIENYACNSKEKLLKQEGLHIKAHDNCVNKNIAGRTNQEYNEDETIKNRNQQRCRDYKAKHPEQMKQYWKNYYERKTDTRNEIIQCQCGMTLSRNSYWRHQKSNKHQDWLKQQPQEPEPENE